LVLDGVNSLVSLAKVVQLQLDSSCGVLGVRNGVWQQGQQPVLPVAVHSRCALKQVACDIHLDQCPDTMRSVLPNFHADPCAGNVPGSKILVSELQSPFPWQPPSPQHSKERQHLSTMFLTSRDSREVWGTFTIVSSTLFRQSCWASLWTFPEIDSHVTVVTHYGSRISGKVPLIAWALLCAPERIFSMGKRQNSCGVLSGLVQCFLSGHGVLRNVARVIDLHATWL